MKVKVRWLKSPLRRYGLAYGYPGRINFIPVELAKEIEKNDPDMIIVDWPKEKPVKVKDAQAKKPRTRPVTREKKG